jgi:hypothetical protein
MLIAIVFLVIARLAKAGREVLTLEERRTELLRLTSELNAELATRTAPETMMARAANLGFHAAGPEDVLFITIDGYIPPADFIAPRPPATDDEGQVMLSPAYTETLGDWLMRWIGAPGSSS